MVKSPWILGLFVIGLLVSACGGMRPLPEPARVRFVLEPAQSRVYIDERFVGSARLLRTSAGPPL